MKIIHRSHFLSAASLLLAAALLASSFSACRTEDDPSDDTTADTTAVTTDTRTDTAAPEDVTEPATDAPAADDDNPLPDGEGYLPEPTRNHTLTPDGDGALLKLGFYRSGETPSCGDLTHNAVVYGKSTAWEASSVTYGEDSFSVPAFRHTDGGKGIAFDLSVYGTDALRAALADGYTIHLAVQFTGEVGTANRALFSGTEYGLCGLWIEGGCFKLVHYTSEGLVEVRSSESVKPGALYIVTGVYAPSAKTVSLYVNGTLCGTAGAADLTVGEASGLFVLGADSDGDSYGSYASYPALFTGAALYAGAVDAAGAAERCEQTHSLLARPNALCRNGAPVADGSDVCRLDDVKVTGDAAPGNDVTLTGTLINDTDGTRIFRLRPELPADSCTCETSVSEVSVDAHARGTFSFSLHVTADVLQAFPVTVSLMTKAGTVVDTAAATVNPRYLRLEKTYFKQGETIFVTASGGADEWIALYPASYEPGHDATVYYAKFEASGTDVSIPSGVPVNLMSFPGSNKGNSQCDPYLRMPVGKYKLILFTNGYTVVTEIDFEIGTKDSSETEPATEPVTEPVTEPATDPTTEPVAEPVTEPADEPRTAWPGVDVSGLTEPYMFTDKTVYEVGEPIYVQAGGTDADYIAFYPKDYTPGKKAALYYTRFASEALTTEVIPCGQVVRLSDFEGVDWKHKDAIPYYGLPAGEYKLILMKRADKTVIKQIDITIQKTVADPVWEGVDVSGLTEPYMFTNKTTYLIGEDIFVQAGGTDADYIAFYPKDYTPGKKASLFYTRFASETLTTEVINCGEVVKLTDFGGVDWNNGDAKPYRYLPVGEYKLILMKRADKTVIKQIDISIVEY